VTIRPTGDDVAIAPLECHLFVTPAFAIGERLKRNGQTALSEIAGNKTLDSKVVVSGANENPVSRSAEIDMWAASTGRNTQRAAKGGTLGLDFPSVSGPSPEIAIRTEPASPHWFRYHVSRVSGGDGARWVSVSGVRDLKSITISVGGEQQRAFRVRVHCGVELVESPSQVRY
jgi:hypothetical protein